MNIRPIFHLVVDQLSFCVKLVPFEQTLLINKRLFIDHLRRRWLVTITQVGNLRRPPSMFWRPLHTSKRIAHFIHDYHSTHFEFERFTVQIKWYGNFSLRPQQFVTLCSFPLKKMLLGVWGTFWEKIKADCEYLTLPKVRTGIFSDFLPGTKSCER